MSETSKRDITVVSGWTYDEWSADLDQRVAECADGIRVAIFGDWINRTVDVVKNYRTDFYRDAMFLNNVFTDEAVKELTPGDSIVLYFTADENGTTVGAFLTECPDYFRQTVKVRYEVMAALRHYNGGPIPWKQIRFIVTVDEEV